MICQRLHRQMLEALGIRDPETLVPETDDLSPKDPVTENMDFINGEPVKAFALSRSRSAYQDAYGGNARSKNHVELMAQAPNQQAIQAAVSAHIAEHLAFQYRVEIQKELGLDLPSAETELPPEIEAKLSSLVAGKQREPSCYKKGQAEAQQQQQAAQANDPILQLKQKELQIEEQTAMAKKRNQMRSEFATAQEKTGA